MFFPVAGAALRWHVNWSIVLHLCCDWNAGNAASTLQSQFSQTIIKKCANQNLKADLHGTILSHATSLRHAYDTKKSRRILKHALKPYDNRGLKCVISVS